MSKSGPSLYAAQDSTNWRNADGSDISKKHEVNARRAWEISESLTVATQRTPF